MRVQHELSLTIATSDHLDVRRFEVTEGLQRLFEVDLEAVCTNLDIDLDAVIGQPARFSLRRAAEQPVRFWEGVVSSIEQVGEEADHLSSYRVVIRPRLWLLSQRRSYRVFQHVSDPTSALAVLAEWGIVPRIAFDPLEYLGRKYRVQYAESDYHFVCRLLEDAGITFFFEQHDAVTRLVLMEGPQTNAMRPQAIAYENRPPTGVFRELATNVRQTRRLRPGRYTQRDVDYRRAADFPLVASAGADTGVEAKLERFHHNYGAFLFSAESDGGSPAADDHGVARTNLVQADRQVKRRLAAKRSDARRVHLETSAHDLAPGSVFRLRNHPRRDLSEAAGLMVVSCRLQGQASGAEDCDWLHEVDASFANAPFHPPLATRKPQTHGVESATVVGPEDDEIHTDEFGRVRVQFHWDRGGMRDERASCWVPVSQPWGGAGFGAVNIPRIGQEVLVDFLGANPDRPVIVGRVFTKTQPVPYALPKYKTVSGIRSQTSVRYIAGGAGGAVATSTPSLVVPPTAPSPLALPTAGGQRMGAARIQEALDSAHFGALSPNAETHRLRGSEVTFDDRAGNELLYMQAQKNMSVVVKNNATTVVGNRRAAKIGTDDIVNVDNEQLIKIGADRVVAVGGSQTHEIEFEVKQESLQGNQEFITAKTFKSKALEHYLESDESISLLVGDSMLFMRPDFVILQTPFLFFNPGADALKAAIASGKRPQTPNEAAEEERQAAVAAAGKELDAAWGEGKISNRNDLDLATQDLPSNVRTQAFDEFEARHPLELTPLGESIPGASQRPFGDIPSMYKQYGPAL